MLRVNFDKAGPLQSIVHVLKGTGDQMTVQFAHGSMIAQTVCPSHIALMVAKMDEAPEVMQILAEKNTPYLFHVDLAAMEKILKMAKPHDRISILAQDPEASKLRVHIISEELPKETTVDMCTLESKRQIIDTDVSGSTVEFKTSSNFFKRTGYLISALSYADTCSFKTIEGKKGGSMRRGLQITCYPSLNSFITPESRPTVRYYSPEIIVTMDRSLGKSPEVEGAETHYLLNKLKNLTAVAAICSAATVRFGPKEPLCVEFYFGDSGPRLFNSDGDDDTFTGWGMENSGYIRYFVASKLDTGEEKGTTK